MYNDYSLSPKKLLRGFPTLPKSALSAMPYALGLLAFLGFLDAVYLTILHYKNALPPCTIHGCEVVLSSKFATIGTVPIALIGAGYYLFLIILVGIFLHGIMQKKISNLLLLLTGAGLVIGILLVLTQAFILHAFCQYCLASEVIDFLLFDCAWWLWRKVA